MTGWVPVEISFPNAPNMVWPKQRRGARLRWLRFGNRRLTEPFFRQSVEKIRCQRNVPSERLTALASLLTYGSSADAPLPVGFIFHISRCGSTVVSNLISASHLTNVVAEAQPVNRLFMPYQPGPGLPVEFDVEAGRYRLANAIFNILSTYRCGQREPVVIKFTSHNCLTMTLIRKLWPSVPSVMIVRNPVEVLVSNLNHKPPQSFVDAPDIAYAMCNLTVPPTLERSYEDYCARILGLYMNIALNNTEHGLRVIDYTDINVGTANAILRFFGLDGAIDPEKASAVLSVYSKDVEQKAIFFSDTSDKWNRVTRRIVEAADKWANPIYRRLRSRSGLE